MLTVSIESLQDLVTNALERMSFVFLETSESTPGEVLAGAVASSSIELRGSTNYVVTVSATEGLVQEIASGMMGCDPEEIDIDDHGRATVSELANVIGGELVMQLSGDEEGLLIGLPRDLVDEEVGRMADQAGQGGLLCIVSNESGSLMVTFTTD